MNHYEDINQRCRNALKNIINVLTARRISDFSYRIESYHIVCLSELIMVYLHNNQLDKVMIKNTVSLFNELDQDVQEKIQTVINIHEM